VFKAAQLPHRTNDFHIAISPFSDYFKANFRNEAGRRDVGII